MIRPARDQVWMVGWEYPPHNSGGLGVACQGLTQSLAGMNTQIFFTLPFSASVAASHLQFVDCSDPRWDEAGRSPFSAYSSVPRSVFLSSEALNAAMLGALPQSDLEYKVNQYADRVTEEGVKFAGQYDLIHAHDWMSFPAGLQLKNETGKPLVAHVHSTEFDRIPGDHGSSYIHQVEYEGLRLADKVIAVSFYTRQILIHRYGIQPDKIEVVHNGMIPSEHPVDPGQHHFATKRPVVVFMGRLTNQKGPDYFVLLAQQVLKKLPTALFILAGSGDLYQPLLTMTAKEGLSGSVLYSGFLRGEDQAKLLNRADVFVMPSLSEPFGLAALEAAAHHTPVIISKNAGVTEVLPSAISIDFWDLQKMSSTIVELIGDPLQKEQIVKEQLKEVEQVTWKNAAHKVKHIYRSLFTDT